MQRQQHASNSSGSGGSSSISGGGGGGGSNSSSSSSQVIYGDLGSALIREAEIFDATNVDEDEERDDNDDEFKAPFAKRRKKKSMQYDADESEDPERAWREALGEDNDEEDENEVQEFDEDEGGQCEQDPAVVKRSRKARAFLDHLIVATAEDAPIGGQNQVPVMRMKMRVGHDSCECLFKFLESTYESSHCSNLVALFCISLDES